MNKYIVLGGAGAMGQVIVRDLAEFSPASDQVVIADFSEENARKLKDKIGNARVSAIFADLKDTQQLAAILKGATCVINSTPYAYNLEVMEAALTAGCHYMDLGGLFHMTKKQLLLHERFKEKNLLAVLGMGAAPGMTNVMAAEAAQDLDTVESIDISVGCVDFNAIDHPLPAPYALDTILDEYTAEPMVFDGEYRAEPPMSGKLDIDFPKPVGRVSAILTLHSEVLTLPTSYKDKGIKRVTFRLGLPSDLHERFHLLCTIGFGSKEAVQLDNGSSFVPRFALAKLL
ncbi:MAG TPA: saccharopine dehydrogenase NADP-binding domain-containing protein, partial [Chroococcales cyanobacterium]